MNSEDDYEIPFDIYGDSLKVKTLVEGVSSGILVGGNLSLICSAEQIKDKLPPTRIPDDTPSTNVFTLRESP